MKEIESVGNGLRDPDFLSVPIELHGQQKKLKFMWTCMERFRRDRGLDSNEVKVLDIGCSNGLNVSIPIASCGYQVTGIDLHLESIEYARKHDHSGNARFLCQNLSDLSDDERFDIVILSDILEHVHDPAGLCLESMRYLRKGGRVLISIPNGFGPYELEQRLIRVTGLNPLIDAARSRINRLLGRRVVVGPAYNVESGHVQFFHLRDFRALLDRVGLEMLEMENGALFGGNLSYPLGKLLPFVVPLSLKLANHLPRRWVSTWYFSCSVGKKTA